MERKINEYLYDFVNIVLSGNENKITQAVAADAGTSHNSFIKFQLFVVI